MNAHRETLNPPKSHPEVTIRRLGDTVTYETRTAVVGGIELGVTTLALMIGIIGFFPWRESRLTAAAGGVFLFGCTLQLTFSILLTRAKTRITVAPDKVRYFFGLGRRGFAKSIPRTTPMTVIRAHRGCVRWFRKVDDIVVRNAEGQEIHFGGFLDKPRQDFLAAHLARELTPVEAEPPSAS